MRSFHRFDEIGGVLRTGDAVAAHDPHPDPIALARRHGAPEAVVAKVLQRLVRAGLVVGTRGTHGGYRLARSASRMTVLDVLRVFDPELEEGAASGSDTPLDRLLTEVFRMLRPSGAFVVGSRNRLFNLFSLNDYTRLEQKLGTVDGLLTEAVAIASAPDMNGAIDAARATDRRDVVGGPARGRIVAEIQRMEKEISGASF